jgi:predicted nicotinamide N-methyase
MQSVFLQLTQLTLRGSGVGLPGIVAALAGAEEVWYLYHLSLEARTRN